MQKIPSSVLRHLSERHGTIIHDYLTPDRSTSEHCGLIAYEIAKLLLHEGYEPYIGVVAEDAKDTYFIRPKVLFPQIYGGRVAWGAHQVCCSDDMAYDPIVGSPIDLYKYTREVFGEDIQMGVLVSREKLKEFLARLN